MIFDCVIRAFGLVRPDDPRHLDGPFNVLRAAGHALIDLLVDAEGRPLAQCVGFAAVDPDELRVHVDQLDRSAGNFKARLFDPLFFRPADPC